MSTSGNSDDLVIGIDAGGTEIKAGILRGGEIIALRRFPTEREFGPEHSVAQVLNAAVAMQQEFPNAHAIALVVPGVVDSKNGIEVFSENLLWENVPFGPELGRLTGLPWGFGHDVRFAGVAEATYGSGKGYADSFFLSIGTGIAGAMIVDGELIDNPYGGEIGHMDVHSGRPCACGVSGCLESIATGPSIYSIYAELAGIAATEDTPKFGAREVLLAAKNGDRHALEAWDIATRSLGEALAAYVSILAPDLIILGGGVSNAGTDLVEPIGAYLESRLTFQKRPRIALATLGDTAGLIGAGILARRSLAKHLEGTH